jgi:hypothetical protein
MNYEEALSLIKSKRRWAAPNGGFQRQLKLYHKSECDLKAAASIPECAEILSKLEKPRIETWRKGTKTVVEY